MDPVSEQALLEYLRGYQVDHPSLDDAFKATPALTLEKLCDASYHHQEWFTPPILEAILARFPADPGRGFWILHNLAAQDESQARRPMDHYATQFPPHPDPANDAIFYIATNNAPLLRQDLIDLTAAHIAD